MTVRAILLLLMIGLMGSRWDGQAIVAKTIESELQLSGNASLVVEVVRGIEPANLLGRKMIYGRGGESGYYEAVVYSAEWSGRYIRIIVFLRGGPVPKKGEGAIIL